MSNKRAAATDLNHDNWDDTEEQEEPGEFQQADASELKGRVIKKAKRRGLLKEDSADKPALFTGFKGFGIPVAQNPTFSFNKKEGATTSFPSLVTSNGDSKSSQSGSDNRSGSTEDKADDNKSKFLAALKALNESMLKWLTSHMEKNPYCYFSPVFTDYEKHLLSIKQQYRFDDGDSSPTKAQNLTEPEVAQAPSPTSTAAILSSVSTPTTSATLTSPAPLFTFGTTKKVDGDSTASAEQTDKPAAPLFNFGTTSSPPKTDKEPSKPFSFLSQPTGDSSKSDSSTATNTEMTAAKAAAPTFSFGNKAATGTSVVTGSIFGPSSTTSGTFSFGLNKPATTSAAMPSFSFGKPVATDSMSSSGTTAVAGFSFKSDIAKAKSEATPAASNEEEEYVPPKPEVENKITEDDALYTKRVKLFYNKDGKYVDKGVGNLFIKPLESGKNSLLIRADTNLGTILLNISLSESIPIQRMGKKDVTLVCVPNPPMEVKKAGSESTAPTMLLIRVKESSDADELCEKLNEYKSAS